MMCDVCLTSDMSKKKHACKTKLQMLCHVLCAAQLAIYQTCRNTTQCCIVKINSLYKKAICNLTSLHSTICARAMRHETQGGHKLNNSSLAKSGPIKLQELLVTGMCLEYRTTSDNQINWSAQRKVSGKGGTLKPS